MKFYPSGSWFLIFIIPLHSYYNLFAQTGNTLAIENIAVIDVKKGELLDKQSVLISGNTIIGIGNADELSIPINAQRIDGSGKFILPGLIDGHTHLSANQNRESDLQAMLKSGITAVRDMGGNATVYKTLTEKAASGALQIPEIYFSAVFFGPQFMIDPRVKVAAGPYAPGQSPWMRLVNQDADLQIIIDDAIVAGVRGVKLYSSLKPEQVLAITQAAHAKGLRVWGHGTIFPSKPSDFVKARPDGISHALSLAFEVYGDMPEEFNDAIRNWLPTKDLTQINENDEQFEQLLKAIKAQDIIFEPTISAWKNPEGTQAKTGTPTNPVVAEATQRLNRKSILDWNDRITKKAIEYKVKISAGTDQTVQMKWVQDEISFLNELGLPPLEAIRAATLTNAEVVGLADQLGSLEVGKKADLLILDKNPLEDIKNIRAVHMVFKAGIKVTD